MEKKKQAILEQYGAKDQNVAETVSSVSNVTKTNEALPVPVNKYPKLGIANAAVITLLLYRNRKNLITVHGKKAYRCLYLVPPLILLSSVFLFGIEEENREILKVIKAIRFSDINI